MTFVSVKPVYRKKVISILYLVNIYCSYTEHNGWSLKWERVGEIRMWVSDSVSYLYSILITTF